MVLHHAGSNFHEFRRFSDFILVFERHLKGNSTPKYEKKKYYKRRTAEATATFASVIESLKTASCKLCYCYLILYIVTYIIESSHKKLTFVVRDPLHIDAMKAFSVDKVTFILARSNNANLHPIDATNYSREQSSFVKPCLFSLMTAAVVGHFMNMLCLADSS